MARVAWGECKRLVSESTCKAGRWKLWVLADDGLGMGRQLVFMRTRFGLLEVPKPTPSLLIEVKEFAGLVWRL